MQRVFVANRGEIALRIVRACRERGVGCVVGTSSVDREGAAARAADRAICIGPGPASKSYLQVDAVVQAALGTGCDAIHPGYGFLSENPRLAARAEASGLTFVGPPAAVIELAGDKLRARAEAELAGLPVLPGQEVHGAGEARSVAERLGYPLLVKAAGGGGGRGIQLVRDVSALEALLSLARSEARAAFGDERLYLERFIAQARHVEVQIAADQDGNVVHVGERECSVQRRYQKVIEEAPAPVLPNATRERLRDAGMAFARAIGYRNLGTVEFVLDALTGEYFFLEMNCRIQVEHPVSEEVSGRDLVGWQLQIADGEPLGAEQSDVALSGHAIECRLTAEDPDRGFQPSPGVISRFRVPPLRGLRVDTHCEDGTLVPPFYDSLLAKLVAHGADRGAAVATLASALEQTEVEGVATNLALLRRIVQHPDFAAGTVTTAWLEQELPALRA